MCGFFYAVFTVVTGARKSSYTVEGLPVAADVTNVIRQGAAIPRCSEVG